MICFIKIDVHIGNTMKHYNTMQEWIDDSQAYLDSLDQTKLGLVYAYQALMREFRQEYEREFFKRGVANNAKIDYWLGLYRICRDEYNRLTAEVFDIEYIE